MNVNQLLTSAVELHQSGRFPEAEKLYRQILTAEPRNAQAMQLLGTLAFQCGHPEAAIDLITRSLDIAPSPQACCNLGEIYRQLGRLAEAERVIRTGLALDRDDAGLHVNLGSVLRERRQFDQALVECRRALELSPDHPQGLHGLMNVLGDLGEVDAAVEAGRRLERLLPDDGNVLHDLGAAYLEAGMLAEACGAMERAIKACGANVNPTCSYSLAIVKLLQGDYPSGWDLYQHRWQTRHFQIDRRNYAQPTWDGSAEHGKTLLLWSEQGYGDMMMMARYIPRAASRMRTIVECPRELLGLLRTIDAPVEWIERGTPPPEFDVHLPLLDLPRVFGTTVETIPADVPYLRADEQRRQTWRSRLAGEPAGLRVGLAWAGRPSHHNDHNRSMSFDMLAPLAVSGAMLFSLQKGPASGAVARTASPALVDWTDAMRDFADTGALIAELDLVICVDTSIAHVAGALGKPVWVMLPFAPDWRWLPARQRESPWYPTMRLFRQPRPRDWTTVVAEAAAELEKKSRAAVG